MVVKEVLVKDIISFLADDVIAVHGELKDRVIDNITNIERVNSRSLDWINPNKANKQQMAENSIAQVLLVDESITYSSSIQEQNKCVIVVDNPKMALIHVIRHFFKEEPQPGIHPSAFIHPEAKIGENVYVGPNCYIGKVVIGDDNIIYSGVHIYDRTTIGNHNVIHSGAVICVDGLGCVRNEDGTLEELIIEK